LWARSSDEKCLVTSVDEEGVEIREVNYPNIFLKFRELNQLFLLPSANQLVLINFILAKNKKINCT
jgi:hypothetical protein